MYAQGNGVVKEGAEERMQSMQQAFEEAGQLVVDADQAQEEAAAARQEADCLSRSSTPPHVSCCLFSSLRSACSHCPLPAPWARVSFWVGHIFSCRQYLQPHTRLQGCWTRSYTRRQSEALRPKVLTAQSTAPVLKSTRSQAREA